MRSAIAAQCHLHVMNDRLYFFISTILCIRGMVLRGTLNAPHVFLKIETTEIPSCRVCSAGLKKMVLTDVQSCNFGVLMAFFRHFLFCFSRKTSEVLERRSHVTL